MDWTTTGAPPPMGTSPTLICRLVTGRSRTAASVISLPIARCSSILFRDERGSREDFTKVRVGCEHKQHEDERDPEGRELPHGLLAHGTPDHLLRRYKEQVPPVQRQERQQVEQRQVEADDRQQRQEESLRHRRARHRGYPHGPAHVLHERSLTRYQIPYKRTKRSRDLHATTTAPVHPPAPAPVLHDRSPTRYQIPYKRTKRSRDLHAPSHGLPDRLERPIVILDHTGPPPAQAGPAAPGAGA